MDNNLTFQNALDFLTSSPVGVWGMMRDNKHSAIALSIGETTEVITFERGIPIGVNPDDRAQMELIKEVYDRIASNKSTFYRREYLVDTNQYRVFPYASTSEDILDFKWKIIKL